MIYKNILATIIRSHPAPLIELRRDFNRFPELRSLLQEKDWDDLPRVLEYCIQVDDDLKVFLGGEVTSGILERGGNYDVIDILGVSKEKDRVITELKDWQERMLIHSDGPNRNSFSLEEISLNKAGNSHFIYAVDNLFLLQFPPRKWKCEAYHQEQILDVPVSPIKLHLMAKANFERMAEEGKIFYRG